MDWIYPGGAMLRAPLVLTADNWPKALVRDVAIHDFI